VLSLSSAEFEGDGQMADGTGELPVRTRKRERRDASAARARILDAAERRFAGHGVAGTALREIAEDAGVAINLISYHFKTKEDLLEAVLDEHAARITSIRQDQLMLLELRYSPEVPPVREIIAALISPIFRLREDDPALWTTFVGLLNKERGSTAWRQSIGKRVAAMLRQHAVLLHRALPTSRRSDLIATMTIAFLSVTLSSADEVRSIIGDELTAEWDEEGFENLLTNLITAAATSLV
jgi:AcrR family transcriptional regulator